MNSILTDESLSTNGLNYKNNMQLFINGLLRKLSISLNIPLDIVSILKKMYTKEIIHLLAFSGRDKHFCINLEDIL